MKNNWLSRFLPALMIVVTLYLFDTVHATAAAEPSPGAVSDNALPASTTSDLPAAAATVSDNTLTFAPASDSGNTPSAAPTAESDCISSAAQFCGWLNAHMYSGGRARLTENITLDTSYTFIPYPNMPPLLIDTDAYTVYVRADVELWSDGRLTFSGNGGAQSIFHVEKGGSLLLDGVTVEAPAESPQYALWQEEGASLTVGSTFAPGLITGNIHYAAAPFVTDTDSVCVIVEQGQLLDGQLPKEVTCRVNYQGSCLEHEPVAVSWDMTNIRRQQDERQRFQAQGVFSEAQSNVTPVCTVVYHDYPLTFTEAKAFIRENACTFQGNYIKQEDTLLTAASPEYSFDGQNWIREGENNVLSADNGFYISFPCDQWDTETYPYIHIRLRAAVGEQVCYSNVLRYAANNLDAEEDLGGSRGGGTAVVDPPADPDETKKPEAPEKPAESNPSDQADQPAGADTPDSSAKPAKPNKPDPSAEPAKPNKPDSSAEPVKSNKPDPSERPTGSDTPNQSETPAGSDKPDHPQTQDKSAASQNQAPVSAASAAKEPTPSAAPRAQTGGAKQTDSGRSQDSAVTTQKSPVITASGPSDPETPAGSMASVSSAGKQGQTQTLLLAAGFVLLSAAAGAIGFFLHSGGTKR